MFDCLTITPNMKEYKLKEHQIKLANLVHKLDSKNLYYLTSQANILFPNHTVNEIKKHITNTIKKYVRSFMGSKYSYGVEKDMIKYCLFIETTKEFNQAIYNFDTDMTNMKPGLHFHLFITSVNQSIHIPQIIHDLFLELTSQKLKAQSIRKYDYIKLEQLNTNFVNYHTKQHYYAINKEMLLFNL